MNKILICLVISLASYSIGKAQKIESHYAKIGQPCPNLLFSDVRYNSVKQLSVNELKGKWVILDFWNRYCSNCIAEFPELDSLQKEFEGKVKVLLVGYTGSQHGSSDDIHIQKLYERVRVRERLSLSIAFDSLVFHQLKVHTPLKLIIDPTGIVRAITYKFNSEDMKTFLAGKEPRLPRSWFKNENLVTYDPNLPFLINSNGGNDTDFLYRSVFSEYKDYMLDDNQSSFAIKGNKLQVVGTDLASLYRFAYLGVGYVSYNDPLYEKFSSYPILEIKDRRLFEVDKDLRTGMYAYSLIVPSSKAEKVSIMKMVQKDLEKYFAYKAGLETRKIPVWQLVTITKSRSPKNASIYKEPFDSINDLMNRIVGFHYKLGAFINSTGLNDKIDITLNCNMANLEDVKRALRENGFDLVKGEKDMQVLVIKDNPDENN